MSIRNRRFFFLLAILFCLSLLPISAFADDNGSTEQSATANRTEQKSYSENEEAAAFDETDPKDTELDDASAMITMTEQITIPTFVVEPVGETTKAVQYGESVQLQVAVKDGGEAQFSYSWTKFDKASNSWIPIGDAENCDICILEAVTEDCQINCYVSVEMRTIGSVTFTVRVSKNSEKCGNSLEWSLENGVLTITGTGEMYDYYDQEGFGAPWYDRMDEIQSVVISSGVESVGGYAFAGARNLTNVSFSNSTWIIGDHAFQNTGLVHVYLPDAAFLNIGGYSFEGCANLQTVSIGKSPEKILEYAFANCPNLTAITFRGLPPFAGQREEFHGLIATIQYPCDIIEQYRPIAPPTLTDEQLQESITAWLENIVQNSTDCQLTIKPFHTEAAGIAIAPTCTATGLTAGEYCSACGEVLVEKEKVRPTGHCFEKGICTVCKEQESTAYRLEISASLEVPEELTEDDRFDTVEKILYILHQKAREDFKQFFGVELAESGLFDFEISASAHIEDNYVPLNEETFPQSGISFIIPYPDGTNRIGFDFLVHHLTHTGEIENIQLEKTETGLKVTVMSLSPFTVSAMAVASPSPSPSLSPTKPTPISSPSPTATPAPSPSSSPTATAIPSPTPTPEVPSSPAPTSSTTSLKTEDEQNSVLRYILCVAFGLIIAGSIIIRRKMK